MMACHSGEPPGPGDEPASRQPTPQWGSARVNVGSLFSGIGGLDLDLDQIQHIVRSEEYPGPLWIERTMDGLCDALRTTRTQLATQKSKVAGAIINAREWERQCVELRADLASAHGDELNRDIAFDQLRVERDAERERAEQAEARVQPLVDAHQKLLFDVTTALGERDMHTADIAPAVAEVVAERDEVRARLTAVLAASSGLHPPKNLDDQPKLYVAGWHDELNANDRAVVEGTTKGADKWSAEETGRVLGIHRIGVAKAERKLAALGKEIAEQRRVVAMRSAAILAIESRRASPTPQPAEPKPVHKVVDLMQALQDSLDKAKTDRRASPEGA